MLTSRHHEVGQSHNIHVANRSVESVAKLRYLGTNLTGRNFVREKN
jgi:hypothetical protein